MKPSKPTLPEAPIAEGKLNEVKYEIKKRPNGTLRIQQDFQYCPSMAEQHTAHLTDLNYLYQTYKPDELAQYLAAKNSHRQQIMNHDFSQEPNLQEAKNLNYQLQQAFQSLKPEIRSQFRNHVEFLKFIDVPENQDVLIRAGIMTKKEIAKHVTTPPATPAQGAPEGGTPQQSSPS